jgi:hypothetical protein
MFSTLSLDLSWFEGSTLGGAPDLDSGIFLDAKVQRTSACRCNSPSARCARGRVLARLQARRRPRKSRISAAISGPWVSSAK